MTELPRIPPTGPAAGIRPLKPTRKGEPDPKRPRPRGEKHPRKDDKEPDTDEIPSDPADDEAEPGKGRRLNLRV